MAQALVFFPKATPLDFSALLERLRKTPMFGDLPIDASPRGLKIHLPETSLYISHVTEDFVAIEAQEMAEHFASRMTPEQHALLLSSDQRVEIWLEDDRLVADCFNEWLICSEFVSALGPSVTLQPDTGEIF